MPPITDAESLALAQKHLKRVQTSWDPPEWLDLAGYGLYALEAAVVAAAMRLNIGLQRNHWSKVEAARKLSEDHDLPDVADLMQSLNEVRKSEAYGDVEAPSNLDPQDVASDVEEYVEAVAALFDEDDDDD